MAVALLLSHFDIASESRNIGFLAAALAVAAPVALYSFVLRRWKPTTRPQFAARFALWPLVVAASALGGPVARALTGHVSRYSLSVGQALAGVLVISAALAPIFFAIGYAVCGRRFERA